MVCGDAVCGTTRPFSRLSKIGEKSTHSIWRVRKLLSECFSHL